MKGSQRLARRYARALFDAALTAKADVELVRNVLSALATLWRDHASFRALLTNPSVRREDREAAFVALCKRLAPDLPVVHSFATLLILNNRGSAIAQVAEAFSALCDARNGIYRVRITTAKPLSDGDRVQLLATVQTGFSDGRKVLADWQVAPSILGGALIDGGDRQLDATVRGALDRAAQQLIGE